ncbi:MAG: hypothetical protein WC755_07305 [Candidatus Woesearchaeota archaeon]|jgi:hypothetical protein
MAEERLLQGPQEVVFDGIFSIKDINKAVFDFYTQNGYVYFEKFMTETVTEKGKDFSMKGDFKKKLNYYSEAVISYKLKGKNITDVEVLRDNRKFVYNKGIIRIEIESILKTDLEGRFEVSLFAYLYRAFAERFFFKRDIDVLMEIVTRDYKKGLSIIRGVLNLQKYN